jgi:hypothetical protein
VISWFQAFAFQIRLLVLYRYVEGNSTTPPVLVQVATSSLVMLEAPVGGGGGYGDGGSGLSADLTRLLADESILKVFCDGTTGADKRSLGRVCPGYQIGYMEPHTGCHQVDVF